MLAGRRIVLGVSGGVAAYKAAYLARRLIDRGAEVRTIMTKGAARFLGPQTLAAITGAHPILDLFGAEGVSPHTELARWADAVIVAPATAATLSRLAHGISGDPLTATLLATERPVVLAPAMHTEMWEHPATQRTIDRLRADGYRIAGPASGPLAGGDVGIGRMLEPDDLVAFVADVVHAGERPIAGWRVVVSSGGTREAIDPVRYVGNRSSGKMGNAIALAAAGAGADVRLVTSVDPPAHPRIDAVRVESAAEMAEAVWEAASDADLVVMAAAVADFRPKDPAEGKLRRTEGLPVLEFEPTPDILAGVAEMSPRPFLVGFAAEVGDTDEAVAKAAKKGVDLLVANDVARQGSGFGSDTNEVTIVFPDGSTEPWPLLSKREVAERLVDLIRKRRTGEAAR